MTSPALLEHSSFQARFPSAVCPPRAQEAAVVFIVDDDAAMRAALSNLLRSVSLANKVFASAQDFLEEPEPAGAACLVLDVRLPETSGFDVQHALSERGRALPVIFITGHGTIPMTVRAMKAGAVEFLTKPFAEEELLDAIHRALARDRESGIQRKAQKEVRARYDTLTPRERQVMALVVSGLLNKQAAGQLGTSEITVKVHRRQVMAKMRAATLPDLVRMAERLASPPP